MSHVMLLLAHPRPDSYCHAIADRIRSVLTGSGHDVRFHDLYAERFDPIVSAEEAYTTGESVEAYLAREADTVVGRHRAELRDARGLVVVHPNWWGKPPAILSGWMDRVVVPGVAYRLPDATAEPESLVAVERMLVVNTSDTTAEREREVFGDPLGGDLGTLPDAVSRRSPLHTTCAATRDRRGTGSAESVAPGGHGPDGHRVRELMRHRRPSPIATFDVRPASQLILIHR